jgi:hypothetical protein
MPNRLNCATDQRQLEIVLADGRRGQIEAQLRNCARNIGGERVGIGAGPETVRARVGIGLHRLLDAIDELVHAFAAQVTQQLGTIAEPIAVRRALMRDHGCSGAPQPVTDDLVHVELLGPRALDGNPRMHAEIAAPTHRARCVYLNDGFRRRRRIGRKARGLTACGAPVLCTRAAGAIDIDDGKQAVSDQQQQR